MIHSELEYYRVKLSLILADFDCKIFCTFSKIIVYCQKFKNKQNNDYWYSWKDE